MIDSQLKEKRKVIIEKKIALGKASGKIILMGEHAMDSQPLLSLFLLLRLWQKLKKTAKP